MAQNAQQRYWCRRSRSGAAIETGRVLDSPLVSRFDRPGLWLAFALLCATPGAVDLLAPYTPGVECCDEEAGCGSEEGCAPDCTDCACCTPPSATLAAA